MLREGAGLVWCSSSHLDMHVVNSSHFHGHVEGKGRFSLVPQKLSPWHICCVVVAGSHINHPVEGVGGFGLVLLYLSPWHAWCKYCDGPVYRPVEGGDRDGLMLL